MNNIAKITLDAIKDFGITGIDLYQQELIRACELHQPAFGKKWYLEKYREACQDPAWFINSLVSNAAKEGEGALRLWEMASRTEDEEIYEGLCQHAIDEARHGRLYVGMIKYAFDNKNLDERVNKELHGLIPGYKTGDKAPRLPEVSSTKVIIDELIQINIGEIRTRLHQLMLGPVLLSYAPEKNKTAIQGIIDQIINDETKHISYTAKLLNRFIKNGMGDFIQQVADLRWQEINQITLAEAEGKRLFAA